MENKTPKKKKIVRPWIIVVAIILLIPVILSGLIYGWDQLNYLRLRVEIGRVASASGVRPLAIECYPAMDPVCSASYSRMSYGQQVNMLKQANYNIWNPILGAGATSVDGMSPNGIYAAANYDDSDQTNINYRFE